MNENDDNQQEESSSRHLLGALEDLLKRSHHSSLFTRKIKHKSKSLDNFIRHQQTSTDDDKTTISSTTQTAFDLSEIERDEEDDDDDDANLPLQRSRSAPVLPTEIYDQELAAFIQADQQQSPFVTDNFVYNIDLSDSNETSHSSNSRLAIFFEDDFSPEEINDQSSISLVHSSLIKNCLPITEENEEELEQLKRDDDDEEQQQQQDQNQIETLENDIDTSSMMHLDKRDQSIERLSTIYESPSPQPDTETEIDQQTNEKLIVYDLANVDTSIKPSIIQRCSNRFPYNPSSISTSVLTSPVNNNTSLIPLSLAAKQQSSPILFSTSIDESSTNKYSSQHITKMKVIQSSSSNTSDFISTNTQQRKPSTIRHILTNGLLYSHCASNPTPRRVQERQENISLIKHKSEEKFSSDSSSSSERLSSSDEKLLSRSDFILQHDQRLSAQRKASSLKTISITSPRYSSKILYPIDFPTARPTSKSSIEQLCSSTVNPDQIKIHQRNYQNTLSDLTMIKKNLVDIESRLNEAMRELEIEQALIEGEHELVFKQILDASESDQQKIRQLYKNLQLLSQRIMTEKNFVRREMDYLQQSLVKYRQELQALEQQYPSTDEKILQQKELIVLTRKKYEDYEFQLMELDTRCESDLEQAEGKFQNEQKLVTQNAKLRQNTLRELDHQQYMILHQITLEKEQLEREKEQFKYLFKQKKFEANELEQKISGQGQFLSNLYSSLKYPDGISSPKFKQKNLLDEQQVTLREKQRLQERPLTRYLPIRSVDFDLRAHIENAGHLFDSPHLLLSSTCCRGYLYKMGGTKIKTWNRRWFVFDRQRRSLYYYQDKNETKLRGSIEFQSILEVYVDHLHSLSLRSPEPRQATFIVKTIQRPYYLVAPTVETMRIWIDVIITGAEGNTFAEI